MHGITCLDEWNKISVMSSLFFASGRQHLHQNKSWVWKKITSLKLLKFRHFLWEFFVEEKSSAFKFYPVPPFLPLYQTITDRILWKKWNISQNKEKQTSMNLSLLKKKILFLYFSGMFNLNNVDTSLLYLKWKLVTLLEFKLLYSLEVACVK